MPFQINNFTLKQLLQRHDRDSEIIKKHYEDEVYLGNVTRLKALTVAAERKAIRKVLEEVKKKKTTNIQVKEISLFK